MDGNFKRRNIVFYHLDEGWKDAYSTTEHELSEKGIDARAIINHFWDMFCPDTSRLYKVMKIVANDKNKPKPFEDCYYDWTDDDIQRINNHMKTMGFSVSRPSRKELNEFDISNSNMYSFLKLENKNFICVADFPHKDRNMTVTQYFYFKEKISVFRTKFWDKSKTNDNHFYKAKIYFL